MDHILAPRVIHTRRHDLYHGYMRVVRANRDWVFHSLEEQRSLAVLDAPRILDGPESKNVKKGFRRKCAEA